MNLRGQYMQLSMLNQYEHIIIQCHDNPDPDSIGAGYALYEYFKSKGKDVKLIYSGRLKITKPNILMFIKELEIPLEYVGAIDIPQLLITVDCQYGAGNVTKMKAKTVAVIDHHQQEITKGDNIYYLDIRNFLVSASTIVWDLLMKDGFDLKSAYNVQTALYYGLFTDSSGFSEISHPLDKDMRDSLQFNKGLIYKLKNSVLSLRELEIAGMALIRHSYNMVNKFVIVKAQECDPNILGFISDLALQVDSVLVCIVYNERTDGIKYSVRSCTKEVRANELAAYLAAGLGSGGGHVDKAGGFLNQDYFNQDYKYMNADEYFLTRLTAYYQNYEVIDSVKSRISKEEMIRYKELPSFIGAIRLEDVVPVQTSIIIRSLQGDIDKTVEKGSYLIIDYKGRVHFINEMTFQRDYEMLEEPYTLEIDYFPSIRNLNKEAFIPLESKVHKCQFKGNNYIYAKKLDKNVKLFGLWNREDYMYGNKGDYLVINPSNIQDACIIEKEFFEINYEKSEMTQQ